MNPTTHDPIKLRDTLAIVEHAQKYIEQTRPDFLYNDADYEAWLTLDAAMRVILWDMS